MFDSSDFILEPSIVLLGCQAWPPKLDPDRLCAVCDHGIRKGEDRTSCVWCDSCSPLVEAKVRAARIGREWSSKAEATEAKLKSRLPKKAVLTEAQRRRIWNGYKGGILNEIPQVDTDQLTNRAKVGRDWLTSIGQAPDWSLELDSKGKVVRRYTPVEAEVA